jgi:trimeric autotransporter adhesin
MRNRYINQIKNGILALLLTSSASSFAQLSGTKSIPGDFASIADAITNLNSLGVGSGGVVFEITPGHLETGYLPVITATGTSANPIVFKKNGTGLNPKITAGIGTGTMDGIIRLLGSDFITFEGIDLEENSANNTATTNTEWGIALLRQSPTNGCQNVTIKNCRIFLNKAYTASIAIYSGVHNEQNTTAIVPADINGTNSLNKFFSNLFSNVYNGISLNGSATILDVNNEIGLDGANIFTNFGGAASVSRAIYAIQQNNFIIANNNINGGSGTTGALHGIYNHTAVSANADIYNNTITLSSAATTAAMYGIENAAGSTPANNSIKIYNNTINNCQFTAASTGVFIGIENTATPTLTDIYGNTISNFSTPGSGTITAIRSNTANGTNPVNIYNNTIHNISRTGTSGIIYGIQANTATLKVHGNTIHTLSMPAGTSALYGYYNLGAPTNEEYYNNLIYGLNHGGTGIASGIYVNTAAGIRLTYSNTIYSITSGGTAYGMFHASSSPSIYRNKIYNIATSSTTTAVATAIHMSSGAVQNIHNNVIADIKAPSSTAATGAVNGITIAGGTTSNIYFNSIHLDNVPTITGNTSSNGILISSTAPNVDIRNNIIINKSAPTGTGVTSALRRTTTALTTLHNDCNNNLYFSGTPATNRVIYFNGTDVYTTMAAFKAHVSPREVLSVSENLSFISTNGSSADFLKANATAPTKVESGAQIITNLVDDYYFLNSRISFPKAGQINGGGQLPDIGAVEGDYIPSITVDYGISAILSPSTGTCNVPNATITVQVKNFGTSSLNFANDSVRVDVRITDPSNTITTLPSVWVNSGMIGPGATFSHVISTSYNMSSPGSYVISANTFNPDDASNANDTLAPYIFNISGGTAAASRTSVCAGAPVNLTLTNTDGAVQWQLSTDNGTTWSNATGTGNTSYTFNTTAPNTDVIYRALICGTLTSNSVAVTVTFVNAPVSSNVSRCGEGTVSLTATASGNITWFSAATGGAIVGSGNTITPYVTASTTFFAEASSSSVGVETAAKLAPTTTPATVGNNWGLVFDVVQQATTIQSVKIHSVGTAAGSISVTLETSAGVALATAGPFSYPAASTASPAVVTLPLNFTVPVGTGYRLVSSAMSGGSVIRETSGNVFPYTSQSGNVVITSGYINGVSQTYYWFYDWQVTSGCNSARTPVQVTINPAPAIAISANNTSICNGDTVALNVTSQNTDYSYSWNPANGLSSTTGSSINAIPSANITYHVIASDAAGCLNKDSVTIIVKPRPNVAITPAVAEVCEGNSVQLTASGTSSNISPQIGNGTLTNAATGYPAPYGNYYWGGKTQMIVPASELGAAGIVAGPISALSFNVIDLNAVPALNSFYISIGHSSLSALTAFETGLTQVFSSASYTPVLGINTHNFSSPFIWDGVSSIVVETCFNNSSFISNGNASMEQTVTAYNSTLTHRADNATVCAATTISITSQQRPNMRFTQQFSHAFAWSPISTLSNAAIANPVASPLQSTNYSLTVTHGINGCVAVANSQVNINENPVVVPVVTNINCFGDNNGQIEATLSNAASISGPFTYSWQHNANLNASVASSLAAGTYNLSVTSNKGCNGTAQAVVTQPTELVAGLTSSNVTCHNVDNGSASLSVTGGIPPYTYLWNNQAAASAINNMAPGTYSVIITDANGCQKTGSVTITEPTELVISSALTHPKCYGQTTGEINISTNGGTAPYSYDWSGAVSQTNIASNLGAGSYLVNVTDANGCLASNILELLQPTQILGATTVINETCVGMNNGSAMVTVSGGSGFYTYSWNTVPAQTGSTVINLSPGTYTATITDHLGCTGTSTISIAPGTTKPDADFSFANNSGLIFDFTDNSQKASTWKWNFGDGSPLNTTQNPTHTYQSVNNYTVTLIVENVCGSDMIAKTITAGPVGINEINSANALKVYPNPTQNAFNIQFVNNATKSLQVRVVGSNGSIVYKEDVNQFNGVYNNQVNLSHFASGVYTLQMITDSGIVTKRVVLNK